MKQGENPARFHTQGPLCNIFFHQNLRLLENGFYRSKYCVNHIYRDNVIWSDSFCNSDNYLH